MRTTARLAAPLLLLAWLCGFTASAATEDTLAAAKELYGTAAYQDALSMLDRLKTTSPPPDEVVEIEKYRAFCLFAMGRAEDAEHAFVDLLASHPRFRVDEREASPRVVAAFRTVRRRQLPVLLEQAYKRAREAYDRKEIDTAVQQFRLVLELTDDADTPQDQQIVKEMRVLAGGFLNLAEASQVAAVPVAPPPAPPQPSTPPPVTRTFYTADDAGVTPPVAVDQGMPAWPSNLRVVNTKGVLDILINEKGEVEAAVMRVGVHPVFDSLILQRAKQWRYRPATLRSRPVKYRKLIEIKVEAPTS